jgi:N-acetyl-gamma-glutamyl-phosphate reductase
MNPPVSTTPINVGVIGGAGYAGIELLRLLSRHPLVTIDTVTSQSEAGRIVSEVFPGFRGALDIPFVDPRDATYDQCDLVFLATPPGVAMKEIHLILKSGARVIDLSADFRFKNQDVWEDVYGKKHLASELLSEAVYGLPERYRERIRTARLIANPGCYPTAALLGLLPLLKADAINPERIIINSVSGLSGAGRAAGSRFLFAESQESFKAYGLPRHRHQAEIEQEICSLSERPPGVLFVPHLMPSVRGIHTTIYLEAKRKMDWQALYLDEYQDEPFVDILPFASFPDTRNVRTSNVCRISVHAPNQTQLIVFSVIDNLVKGAAGQAIQNMNIMFGLEEGMGLQQLPSLP